VAAADPRFRVVAALAPVTDLARLTDFRGLEDSPIVRSLALVRRSETLAGRRIWIAIGNHDERVGADSAIDLARRIAAFGSESNPAGTTLLVGPWPGHGMFGAAGRGRMDPRHDRAGALIDADCRRLPQLPASVEHGSGGPSMRPLCHLGR
jgi:hypothetical protein